MTSQLKPFICKSDKALHALKYWLRDVLPFNVINDLNHSERAEAIITLGWDTRPDGDYGRYAFSAKIICSDEDVRAVATELCRKEIVRRDQSIARDLAEIRRRGTDDLDYDIAF